MLNTADGEKYSGKFTIGGQPIDGELTFNGAETNLYTHSPNFYYPDENDEPGFVKGVLHDLTKVSLIGCLSLGGLGSASSAEGRYHFGNSKPHFIVHGKRHVTPHEEFVDSIHFCVSDGATIFYDHDAYIHAIKPTKAQIRSLVKAYEKVAKRQVPIGEHPEIAFFTGKREIFKADTILGTVTATNNPQSNMFGRVGGVFISNTVTLNISFPSKVSFEKAIDAVWVLLRFVELIAGRRQNVEGIFIAHRSSPNKHENLHVYLCNEPLRKVRPNEQSPQGSDIPINAVWEPAAFASILTNWLKRHNKWAVARSRFSDSFSAENVYGADRLIGAANMFDLLPDDAVPANVTLDQSIIDARDTCRRIFKALPNSAETQSVLNALGRLGKSNLKSKVRHRAMSVIANLGNRFPFLNQVLDHAVDCRNYFVHGGEAKIDYENNFFETVPFLTDTLEFVFAVSDLIDAGWDSVAWSQRGTTMSHPFGSYRVNYAVQLSAFNDVLPAGRKIE